MAIKGQARKIHAKEPHHERDRHKERTDDGQSLHDVIDSVRRDGQVDIERATGQLTQRFIQIHQPHQVIVHVTKEHAIRRIDDVIIVARQLVEHFSLRTNDAAADARLHV